MEEHQATTAAPMPRCLVRLLVLAGAALTWWLLLECTPAQADDAQSEQTPAVTTLTGTSARAVPVTPSVQVAPGSMPRTVEAVTTPLRQLSHRTAQTGDEATARAPEPARQLTAHVRAAVEPAVAQATAQLAEAVDQTASGLDIAVVEPVLDVAGLQASSPVRATPFQTTPAGSSARPVQTTAPNRVGTSTSAQLPTVGPDAAASPGSSRASSTSSRPAERPGTERPTQPRVPGVPGTPAGGTASGAAAAVLPGLMILVPVLLRRRRLGDGDPLPVGPAYPPGCSPG